LHLDWQMWFASMYTPEEYRWTPYLVWKLLHNDPQAVNLFAGNPFPGKPPKYVRAVLYRYKFAEPGNPQHLWWTREKISDWLPALSANNPDLIEYLRSYGWIR